MIFFTFKHFDQNREKFDSTQILKYLSKIWKNSLFFISYFFNL